MKCIELTQGNFAMVDDEDFEYLSQWRWKANNYGYAITTNRQKLYMHRMLMKFPKGKIIDHINHDRLDNRKENLRICSIKENLRNRTKNKNNTSGYKGVSWNKIAKKWVSYIRVDGKRINLGYFDDITKAAEAYKTASDKYFKQFSNKYW